MNLFVSDRSKVENKKGERSKWIFIAKLPKPAWNNMRAVVLTIFENPLGNFSHKSTMARGYHHLVINVVLDGSATESGFAPRGQICLWHWENLMQYLESRRSSRALCVVCNLWNAIRGPRKVCVSWQIGREENESESVAWGSFVHMSLAQQMHVHKHFRPGIRIMCKNPTLET